MKTVLSLILGVFLLLGPIAQASHSGLFFGQRIHKVMADSNGVRLWSDGSIPKDCLSYISPPDKFHSYTGQTGDGTYWIKPAGATSAFQIFCDMTTDGGGYMVFQNRIDGSTDFYQGWAAYASGFGTVSSTTNFWLGNDKLNLIAGSNKTLYVKMQRAVSMGSGSAYAKYTTFSIGNASTHYTMYVGGFSGTAGDSMSAHSGSPFATKDADYSGHGCPITYKGAWWYINCHLSNLNGYYYNGYHSSYADGMEWDTWTGYNESLAQTRMMVK